nr:SLAM family member 7-like isoform X2 [Anolis sagrei ordinatus]
MGPFLLALVALLAGSFGEEDENVENVTGIVGASVAFQLKFSSPFEIITWLRTKGKDVDTVGVLKPGEKCLSIISLISLQGRLNVSEDCKTIEILRLQEEDSATFRARVQIPEKKELLIFLFRLQVFRHLLDSDVQIHCKAIENETWRLNCSAGESEEGVTFKMAASGREEHSGRLLDVQDGRGKEENLNVSCTARNPISTASSTRPLRDLCGELYKIR